MSFPIACSMYCTTRCDNACRHCTVRSPFPGDAEYNAVARNIGEFAKLGGRYIDLTGGNPLLVPWLPDALQLCKDSGLISSLTVSGPMISKRLGEWGKDWLDWPSILRFSVDGTPGFHNANRGGNYYRYIEEGLQAAKEVRKRRAQLVFTVFPGEQGNISRGHFASVLRLARKYNALVNVNPYFSVAKDKAHGVLDTSKPAIVKPDNRETLDLIWFARQADVQFSRGKLRFWCLDGNNPDNPTCRAIRDVATISSDNKLVLPCYHRREKADAIHIPLDNGLLEALESPERRHLLRRDGRFNYCKGCTIWCYIMPSLWYHKFDRVAAWLHALSGPQIIRDRMLQQVGRLHPQYPYPDFVE